MTAAPLSRWAIAPVVSIRKPGLSPTGSFVGYVDMGLISISSQLRSTVAAFRKSMSSNDLLISSLTVPAVASVEGEG